MGFWDKINNFRDRVNELENNIYTSQQDLMEMYEKNLKLEAEIQERTYELELANQRLVTVQHIWEMMNSSQPLTKVLDSIVNSLQGELGYLFSCIVRKKVDNQGQYLDLLAASTSSFLEHVHECIGQPLNEARLEWHDDKNIDYFLSNNKIHQSKNVQYSLEYAFPNISKSKMEEFIKKTEMASCILIPLQKNGKHFASLILYSSRAEAQEAEINFLKLFAKQIELAITVADLFQTVKEQAVTDGLTGLHNRRYFEEEAQKEVLRAQRQNQKFTIIGLDLDHLKQINDTYGHSCGDIAIKTVAEVLKRNARSIDTAARMGGEEFNILLPGIGHEGGLIAAERIRKAIESVKVDIVGGVTASVGVATFGEHSNDLNELLELTDQAMYTSKKNGRNRVTLANPEDIESWHDIALDSFLEILKNKNISIDNTDLERINNVLNSIAVDSDALYTVSDMLSGIYNPYHKVGSTKQKISVAEKLAKRFELSKEDTDRLKIAILLYDIGNMMLPKDLLQKESPLTEEEKEIIKTHPIIAAKEILQPISVIHDIIPIIEHHHENWDGTGYPAKAAGQNIPLCSQIVLIIDAYFALTEQRSYRDAKTNDEAIQIIKEGIDKKWNSRLANEFIDVIGQK